MPPPLLQVHENDPAVDDQDVLDAITKNARDARILLTALPGDAEGDRTLADLTVIERGALAVLEEVRDIADTVSTTGGEAADVLGLSSIVSPDQDAIVDAGDTTLIDAFTLAQKSIVPPAGVTEAGVLGFRIRTDGARTTLGYGDAGGVERWLYNPAPGTAAPAGLFAVPRIGGGDPLMVEFDFGALAASINVTPSVPGFKGVRFTAAIRPDFKADERARARTALGIEDTAGGADVRVLGEFAPGEETYGRRHLAAWFAAAAALDRGISDRLRLAVMGDSHVGQANLTRALRDILRERFATATPAPGWISAGAPFFGEKPDTNVPPTGVAASATGTWTYQDEGTGVRGLDLCEARSTQAGATITITADCTSFVVHHIGAGATVAVDGGAPVALVADGTNPVARVVPAGAYGAHTMVLTVTGSAVVLGFEAVADGLVVDKLGNGGSTSADWLAADNAAWGPQLTSIDPDAVVILLGTNDQKTLSAATYRANITAMVARVRAAVPGVGILLQSPWANTGVNAPPSIRDLADELRELGPELGVAVLDAELSCGPFDALTTLGLTDGLNHPNQTGGRFLAERTARLLVP